VLLETAFDEAWLTLKSIGITHLMARQAMTNAMTAVAAAPITGPKLPATQSAERVSKRVENHWNMAWCGKAYHASTGLACAFPASNTFN